MFKKRSVQQKYDLFSKIYDTLEWPLEKFLFSKWRKKVITKFKGKVLEVGVGTGKNLQYYNDDVNVVGIDISQKMLNKAIDRSKNLKNVSLLKMDAQDLKFKDNTFDIVFCTFVLCSVPDPVKTLKEMKRVCKPGGKLVMIEHVKSKNWLVWLFQKIHNPFTFYLFGFNIDRDTIGNIKKAGLTITKDKKLALFDVFRQIEATCK
ncbi:class I SAM-dependent methyltransferase [Candidatus Woesearchaeota archaeon]|nr:MAG: class I SAM-dependent methyltransferase [Candidatus Woesearchaeota archaeon]